MERVEVKASARERTVYFTCPTCGRSNALAWRPMAALMRWESHCAVCGQPVAFAVPLRDELGRCLDQMEWDDGSWRKPLPDEREALTCAACGREAESEEEIEEWQAILAEFLDGVDEIEVAFCPQCAEGKFVRRNSRGTS